ncbi:MAG: glutamine-hydrolyzing carbamoyl-phosphate synthase small subunit [Fimbriimonadaceae bacterium]|nr:MAG: glutamine-hydrolyzing carbamoyl-phosphate synthase small subunit [Fimbriimonadaceae bacterium]
MESRLVLSDGTELLGRRLGAQGDAIGEVVFNTGMTGYQEILTDPSYAGQIVVFTYPLIGNYGINEDDFESERIQVAGIVVREACKDPSNWRSRKTIHQLLEERGIPAIEGIDTRALTKRIRSAGVTMGIVSDQSSGQAQKLSNAPHYDDREFVGEVSTREPYGWGFSGREDFSEPADGYKGTLAVLDCGLKFNILRRFAALGIQSKVFPCTASAEEILSINPNGILLSPGPGDPAKLGGVVTTAQKLLGQRPIFGICLGNQILCQAVGGSTYKLKFGHRGSNHPVKDLEDGTVTMTSQNHGYAVDPESLDESKAVVTQLNVNDGTVEGIRIKGADASSIQYHPEAAPGPWDSRKYFVRFVDQMLGAK